MIFKNLFKFLLGYYSILLFCAWVITLYGDVESTTIYPAYSWGDFTLLEKFAFAAFKFAYNFPLGMWLWEWSGNYIPVDPEYVLVNPFLLWAGVKLLLSNFKR